MTIEDLTIDKDNVMLGRMHYKNRDGNDVVYYFALELVNGVLEDHIEVKANG